MRISTPMISEDNQLLDDQHPPKPQDPLRGHPEILRATSGEEFEQTPGSCDEGVDEAHVLRYRQRPFSDILKPCSAVAALEIIGPQLWLGTAAFGEGVTGRLTMTADQ